MPICSVTSSVKWGLVLGAASIFLWMSAIAFHVPGTPFGTPPIASQPVSAEELGLLDPRATSPGEEICSLAVSPDGKLLAMGSFGGMVRLWKAPELLPLTQWQAHGEKVTALAFFPDSRSLLTSGADQTVARWSVAEKASPRLTARWPSAAFVTALAVAPDGRTVAIASVDRLGFFEAEQGYPIPESELRLTDTPIRALAFAPDGRSLACGGGGDNAVRVWGLAGGQPVLRGTLEGYPDIWVRGLAYTADGDTLVSLDTRGHVLAWDRDGRLLGETSAGLLPCLLASLGAGGQFVLTKSVSDTSARLWRLPDRWWRQGWRTE
jgi:WD40 repeat protein